MNDTLEQRVERIEKLINKVVEMAESHPMGKMILRSLGL